MGHVAWLAAVVIGVWMSAATAQEIESVLVEGNERIEADTVRSYLSVGPGDAFDSVAVNQSLKSLFETGLFRRRRHPAGRECPSRQRGREPDHQPGGLRG